MRSVALLLLMACSCSTVADTFLEERKVTRSDYYTGTPGEATLEYISLVDWLEYRLENDKVENAAITDEAFIIDDPALLGPLYEEANRILANWPGTIPTTAIFLQAGATTSYNAYTTPENEIILQMGVLSNPRSMDEISALLAHELSHVLLGHNLKLNYLETAQTLFRQYAKTKSLVTTLETISYDGEELSWDQGPEYVQKIQQIERDQDLAFRFYRTAHSSLNSRGDEIEADRLAMDLMMAIEDSYPSQLREVLDKISTSHEVNSRIEQLIVSESASLIDQYQQEIIAALQNSTTDVQSGEEIEAAFSDFGENLVERAQDVVVKGVMNLLSSTHPVPERRLTQLNNYAKKDAAYPVIRINRGPPEEDPRWLAYRGNESVSLMMENIRLGMSALDSLNLDQPQEALEFAREQASLQLIENPFATFVQFQVFLESGRNQDALNAVNKLSQYYALPTIDAKKIGEFVLDNKGVDGINHVNEIIRQKEAYLGTIPNFYTLKIRVAQLAGDTENARLIASECVNQYSHEKELYAECAPHAGIDLTAARQTSGFMNSFSNFGKALSEGINDATSAISSEGNGEPSVAE